MLFLREANWKDVDKEYEFITTTPLNEDGFTNPDFSCTKMDFTNTILPRYIKYSKGIDLPKGWVPSTEFFLWNDSEIIGLFRIRHYLNEFLSKSVGHIGYSIKKNCRGQGYATEGLRLAIEKAWLIIPENEIYMSVHKENVASLKVQIKNSAYIHHEDDKTYFTRIKR